LSGQFLNTTFTYKNYVTNSYRIRPDTLQDIKEKDKTFLLDAPISKDSLFWESLTAVMEKISGSETGICCFSPAHQLVDELVGLV